MRLADESDEKVKMLRRKEHLDDLEREHGA